MEIPVAMVVEAVATAIAVPAAAVIPIAPAETTTPVVTRMPAVHVGWKRTDGRGTEIADPPDQISRILHRWMIQHFPEEMMEDVRPADVNRIPENMGNEKAPELCLQFRGLINLKKISWT